MAIVVTSKGTAGNNGTSTAAVLSSLTITSGSTIIVVAAGRLESSPTVVYNDGTSNYSLTARSTPQTNNNRTVTVWSLDNVAAASGSGTITYQSGGSSGMSFTAYQVTGLESAGSFDKQAGATNRSTAVDTGVTATTSQADELVVGGHCQEAATNGTYGSDCTDNIQEVTSTGAGFVTTNSGVKIVSAIGTYKYSKTITKDYWAAAVATFKGAADAHVNATATPSLATIGLVIQTPTVTIDYNDHTKDPSCVGAWLFTEGSGTVVDDSSPNSNTGNFKADGEPAWDATNVPFAISGAAPNSVDFDGNNDYISIADNSSLDWSTSFSFVTWFKIDSLPAVDGDYFYIYRKFEDSVEDKQVFVENVGGDVFFGGGFYVTGVGNSHTFGTTPLSTGWYHGAVVYNGTTLKVYLNGVEDGTENYSAEPADGSGDAYIGGNTATHIFNGKITEVAIFNRALTLAEIQDIYNYGLSGVQGVGTTTATPSLASVSVSAQTATASKSESRTASPSLVSISIVPQTPTITISKSSVAVPSLASVSVSISTPNVIISQSRIAVPSLASISIVPQTATASTIVTQSSTATPSIVSITVSAQTPTISTATVTNASPSLSSVSVVAQTPTPKISNSAIAVPSVASISVSIQTAVASQSYSATATPTLTYISVLMLTPTPSKTESRTASPLVQNISVQANTPSVLCYIGCVVQVNTVYLSTSILQPVATTSKNQAITATVVHLTALVQTPTPEVHQSRVASPSIIQATIFVNSATTEVHKSASVTPSIATLSVQPQIATATSSRSVQVSPQTILMAVVTQTAVASTSVISSSTAFPIQASARITVHDPTIYIRERGVVSGIDIDIYLQSAMANRINVLSRMDKLILYKSAMEKKIYNKSRMGKRIDLDSEMETTIFGKSKL